MIQIRRAVYEDAVEIARVHCQSWREAYEHLIPAEALASLDETERATRWQNILKEGKTTVWVALHEENIVGWASASSDSDPAFSCEVELLGIYVLARHYGYGVGQVLLDQALGKKPAYLWVAADNPRAHRFYERNCFIPDGKTAYKTLAGTPIETIRLKR